MVCVCACVCTNDGRCTYVATYIQYMLEVAVSWVVPMYIQYAHPDNHGVCH